MKTRSLLVVSAILIALGCSTPVVRADGPAASTNPPAIQPIKPGDVGEKMRRIVIPEIEFRQANINDVVAFLVKASQDNDTVSPAGDKGVNIILNLNPPGSKPIATPEITFSGRYISLWNAIKTIASI